MDAQITVREEVVTQGRLYRLGKAEAVERARELAEGLGLAGLLGRRTGALSGGQRRRLDIAMALTHRPRVLFLDEPTTGLDPGSRAGLWDLVRRLRDEHGTIVLLTTHHLDEADALSDRLVVVDQGVVVADIGSWASILLVAAFAVCSALAFARTLTSYTRRPDEREAAAESSMHSIRVIGFIGVLLAYALRTCVEAPGERLHRTEYEAAVARHERQRRSRTGNPAVRKKKRGR